MTTPPTALILGASRGLGLALADEYLKRGWRVIATARGGKRTALHDLADRAGGRLTVETLDITNADDVAALRARLEGADLDLLFVNAGVANDPAETIGEVSIETFVEVMVTNALAPMRAIEAFQDLVPDSGLIGVMSSELASITNNRIGTWEVYRASKAALNTLMKSFAARHRADPRALVLMAPGWIRTDMGGPGAIYSVEENIPKVVDVLVAAAGKPGLRFVDFNGADVAW
jgi:NAD(P)-dependent dehydrogenase (short-subunit alcohol dehydrogenase family)